MSDSTEITTTPAALSDDLTAIARQAIVDRHGRVFGYELFDRSLSATPHSAASDAQLLFNVLSHADNGALIDNKTMFINCTHDSLAGGHLELVQPDRIVLEIPPIPGNNVEEIADRLPALAQARERGFRLAFKHNVMMAVYAPWLEIASFVKIDLLVLKPELVERVIQLGQQSPHVQLIAEKVETAQQHELVERLGVKLFQGFWFAKPVLIRGQTIRPAQATILSRVSRRTAQAKRLSITLRLYWRRNSDRRASSPTPSRRARS